MKRRSDAVPAGQGEKGADFDGLSFERGLERLEQIVDRLEHDEIGLEEALRVFEEGVRLSRRLAGLLDEAEQRIDTLLREEGELVVRPFDGSEVSE